MQAEIETILRKRAISQIDHAQGGVYKLAITCKEKGWRSASSDKFKESKFFRVLRALQNRKFEFSLVSPKERRVSK